VWGWWHLGVHRAPQGGQASFQGGELCVQGLLLLLEWVLGGGLLLLQGGGVLLLLLVGPEVVEEVQEARSGE